MAKTPKKKGGKKIVLKKVIKESTRKYTNKKKPTGDGGPRNK